MSLSPNQLIESLPKICATSSGSGGGVKVGCDACECERAGNRGGGGDGIGGDREEWIFDDCVDGVVGECELVDVGVTCEVSANGARAAV